MMTTIKIQEGDKMKTILEIQKLDRQIRVLEREVDKCPASIDFKNYKKLLQEGKHRFEQLEAQASEVIKSYNTALNRLSKYKGNSEIVKKRNVDGISLDNISGLISDTNSLASELIEENRRVEDLVRKSEEIVRRSADLSNKLTEAKLRANTIKARIEAKKQEVAPKIAELEAKIKALEPKVEDKEKYEKYKSNIVVAPLKKHSISSTRIRDYLKQNNYLKARHYLPRKVYRYIRSNHLYEEGKGSVYHVVKSH